MATLHSYVVQHSEASDLSWPTVDKSAFQKRTATETFTDNLDERESVAAAATEKGQTASESINGFTSPFHTRSSYEPSAYQPIAKPDISLS
jgi:hypothetical protein